MFCPECRKQDLKSCVYPGCETVTLAYCPPYYDEEGNCHIHDSNIRTAQYRCSNGHNWQEQTTGSCWCGWPNKQKDLIETFLPVLMNPRSSQLTTENGSRFILTIGGQYVIG